MLDEDLGDIQGTYIITSSPSNMVSYFHENESHTFFTSEFIQILKNGIDNNAPFIEIGEIYEHIKSNLKKKRYPAPMQKNTLNASGTVYFANNYRYIDYSRKVNGADTLLQSDEYSSALETYKKIISEFTTYNNENIDLKIKSIRLIQSSERSFAQSKYDAAHKQLSDAANKLESIEFNVGRIFEERRKIYSLTSSMETKLTESLKAHLTPLIRKELEEELIQEPDLVEKALREKLEQEYKVKTMGIERDLRKKISQEYETAIHGDLNAERFLIIAANPLDTERLRFDQEIREIDSVLKYTSKYKLLISLATKADEIDQIILEKTPKILHLSMHATEL